MLSICAHPSMIFGGKGGQEVLSAEMLSDEGLKKHDNGGRT